MCDDSIAQVEKMVNSVRSVVRYVWCAMCGAEGEMDSRLAFTGLPWSVMIKNGLPSPKWMDRITGGSAVEDT